MSQLYIIGAGGHGAVVAEIAEALDLPIAGFIDDDPSLKGQRVLDLPVIGNCKYIPKGVSVALAIGNNAVRSKLLEVADEMKWNLPILIHPSAIISPSAIIGQGTVVMAQTVVNARAKIGRGCILNTLCSVDHDCCLGDAVHIAPGARLAGNVTIGAGTLMGVGCCVRPGTRIGSGCVIGVGSAVVSDIPDNLVVYGNPVRPH